MEPAHHSQLRILSANLNTGMLTTTRGPAIAAWLASEDPDLLLVQEPCVRSKLPPKSVAELQLVTGNALVAVFARKDLDVAQVELRERLVFLRTAGVWISGVYLPAGEDSERVFWLRGLRSEVLKHRGTPWLLMGDFNLAPREADGLKGDQPSSFTKRQLRCEFKNFLDSADLLDTTRDRVGGDRFTIERPKQGTRFRCDLALVSREISSRTEVRVIHEVRQGATPLTDHSALLLTLKGTHHACSH